MADAEVVPSAAQLSEVPTSEVKSPAAPDTAAAAAEIPPPAPAQAEWLPSHSESNPSTPQAAAPAASARDEPELKSTSAQLTTDRTQPAAPAPAIAAAKHVVSPTAPSAQAAPLVATAQIAHTPWVEPSAAQVAHPRADSDGEAHLQAIIDRLHAEMQAKSSKLATQQHELLEQKMIVERMQSELETVRAQLVERDRHMERLANDATNVDNIDLPELQRRHRMLAAAYRADRRRLEVTEARMHEMRASLMTQESLQTAYNQLKSAHTHQARVVQRLQEQIREGAHKESRSKGEDEKRIQKYRHTIKQQETIIQKLEGLLSVAMKDVRRAKAQDPELEGLKTQLSKAQGEIERHKHDMELVRQEAQKQKELVMNAAPPPNYASEEQVKLLMRAERAERRAAAVEEEMTEMARQNAREIAALKLKLSEKDAQIAGGFGSSSALMLNDLSMSGPQEELRRSMSERPGERTLLQPLSSARRQSPRLDPLFIPGASASPTSKIGGEAVWG